MSPSQLFRPHEGWWRSARFKAGIIAFLAGWSLGVVLQYFEIFTRYDQTDLDHYVQNTPKDERLSDRITVVAITDDDYEEVFNATSPLDSSKVLDVVKTLQGYHPPPRVIAVDLLTQEWKQPLDAADLQGSPFVVWAQVGEQEKAKPGQSAIRLNLGGVAGHPRPPGYVCAAPPFLPEDSDGRIRRYYTSVEANDRGGALVPTMPWLLASVYPDLPLDCAKAPKAEAKLIEFAGQGHNIPILPVSAVMRDEERALAPRISNRIVLLGATYGAARDSYKTSSENRSGVEVLAHTVETELGISRRLLTPAEGALLALVSGLVFFALAFVLKPPYDLVLSALAPVLFAFVGGWIVYQHFGFFIGIASTMLGVPIGVAVEHYVELLALETKLSEMQKRPAAATDGSDPAASDRGGL